VVPEEQVIGVVRKGSRALQQLPASTDAFVWLRLYQQEMRDLVPSGPDEALWWTLRRTFRPLTYDATRMVFNKANAELAANWTLHDLRHSAAKRMVRDPDLTLADVQWVLGHTHITTTEIYTAPTPMRSSPASWPTTNGSARSGPSLPHRRHPATAPRCWRHCSAPRP
jgi:site-specific recombinase XerD